LLDDAATTEEVAMIEVRPFALRCALTVLVASPAACVNGEVDDGQEGAAAVSDEIRKNAESSGKGKKPAPEEPSTDTGTQPEAPAEPAPEPPASSACTRYVSTSGSDSAAGTSVSSPWRTIKASLGKLRAGDVLCVRAGTYAEEIIMRLPVGRADARITFQNYPGEAPLLDGRFAITAPDYWTIRGLRFTNPTPADTTNRLVSILAGTGWILEDNEIFDGRYAGLLVGKSSYYGPPHNYVIRRNVIHDTDASNLYHNPSRHSRGGLIERNVFYNSGAQNVKLGWGGTDGCTGSKYEDFGVGEVVFRYNTAHGARLAALAVAEPGGLYPVEIYRNLLTQNPRHVLRFDSSEGCLGTKVFTRDNAGGLAPKFAEDFGSSPSAMAQMSNNVFPVDPRYDSTSPSGFRPTNPAAQAYGRWAP
jgi:hypothetical protein